MATAAFTPPPAPIEARPQQLWLDVARPVQPRPLRARRTRIARSAVQTAASQMELRIPTPLPVSDEQLRVPDRPIATEPAPAVPRLPSVGGEPAATQRPCFATWLLDQNRAPGLIGELARAGRADTRFPRKGSADDVRAYFGKMGADGDAYSALDDAERAYDRMA